MVNPHPADGKNSVLFQEVSAVRHYMAKGISNGAVGGAEKSAEAIVAPKRAKGRIGSRFKDFNHSDDGQEKRSGKPPKLGDKRRRSGVPRYGRKVSKRMWREGEPKNTSNDDGVLPKPRSARNRHASWCGRGGVPPLPDLSGLNRLRTATAKRQTGHAEQHQQTRCRLRNGGECAAASGS